MLEEEYPSAYADPENINEALQSFQFSSCTSPASGASRQFDSQKRTTTGHVATNSNLTRPRAPSLASHRRNSFDERRIPPTLPENEIDAPTAHCIATAIPSAAGASRSRSGTASSQRPSRELLRRVSTDTALSLDFDSDPETFNPSRPRSITSTRRSSIGGVHLLDNSENEVTSFAREVHIPAFHTVGSSFGGFVAYECRIVTRDGSILKRMKRYSAFCDLRDSLMRSFPNLCHLVDTLPSKSLAKFRVSFLEKRRKRLAFWLATVLLHPILGGTQEAKAWILE